MTSASRVVSIFDNNIRGEELYAIYRYLCRCQTKEEPLTESDLIKLFSVGNEDLAKNALRFLQSLQLTRVDPIRGEIQPSDPSLVFDEINFKICLIKEFKRLEEDPIDFVFWKVFEELVAVDEKVKGRVESEILKRLKINYATRVPEVNNFREDIEIRNFTRFLSYVGAIKAFRMGGKNYVNLELSPQILLRLIHEYSDQVGKKSFLAKSFFDYIQKNFFPCYNRRGDISSFIALPIGYLTRKEKLTLPPLKGDVRGSFDVYTWGIEDPFNWIEVA